MRCGIMVQEKRPFDLLNSSLNKNVIIGLKAGMEFTGMMVSYDVHMNLVLNNAEQLVGGDVKRKLGTVLVRGDSVVYISPAQ